MSTTEDNDNNITQNNNSNSNNSNLVLGKIDDDVDAYSHIPEHGFSLFLANRTKTIHFVRHGEGDHNEANRQAGDDSPVTFSTKGSWKYHDAKLTAHGIEQCIQAREALLVNVNPELVVVSPFTRTLQTAHIMFGGKRIPFMVHDLCRERSGKYTCDKRRRKPEILEDVMPLYQRTNDQLDTTFGFPTEADEYWTEEREEASSVVDRSISFMHWLATRPEHEIAVVTHSSWLKHLFHQFGQQVVEKDQERMHRLAGNAEVRSICLALHRGFYPPGTWEQTTNLFIPADPTFRRGRWTPSSDALQQMHKQLGGDAAPPPPPPPPREGVATAEGAAVGGIVTVAGGDDRKQQALATTAEVAVADDDAAAAAAETAAATAVSSGEGAAAETVSEPAIVSAADVRDEGERITEEQLAAFHEKQSRRKPGRVHRANFFEDDPEARQIRLSQGSAWHHCIQHLGLRNTRKTCALCDRKASTECVTCGVYLCNRRRPDFARACVEVWHDPTVKLGDEMRLRRDAAENGKSSNNNNNKNAAVALDDVGSSGAAAAAPPTTRSTGRKSKRGSSSGSAAAAAAAAAVAATSPKDPNTSEGSKTSSPAARSLPFGNRRPSSGWTAAAASAAAAIAESETSKELITVALATPPPGAAVAAGPATCIPATTGKRKGGPPKKNWSDMQLQQHTLLNLPEGKTFHGNVMVDTPDASEYYKCYRCDAQVRSYCECSPGVYQCSDCYALHVAGLVGGSGGDVVGAEGGPEEEEDSPSHSLPSKKRRAVNSASV